MRPVHIIILSTKSAGSTAMMNYYVKNHSFQGVKFTRHSENETLFWTKAATLLKLQQDKLYRSKISFKPEKVLEELNEFLRSNKVAGIKHATSSALKDEIFRAYRDLIFHYAPRFVEKSPHHLYNRSNLDLMIEFIEKYQHEIDFKIIGLVRDPMDVIYSAWARWKFIPGDFEKEWVRSYENLRWVNQRFPAITIVQYEALARNNTMMDEIVGQIPTVKNFSINTKSLGKWQRDMLFSHHLSKNTVGEAEKFGYTQFNSRTNVFWYLILYFYKIRWKVRSFIKK